MSFIFKKYCGLLSWKMLSKCSDYLEKWTLHCFQINAVGTFCFLGFLFFVSHAFEKKTMHLSPTRSLTTSHTSFLFHFFISLAVSKGLIKH